MTLFYTLFTIHKCLNNFASELDSNTIHHYKASSPHKLILHRLYVTTVDKVWPVVKVAALRFLCFGKHN